RGRQSGMALARLESKCVQGATTEISRRTLSASAIALAQADSAPRHIRRASSAHAPSVLLGSGLALPWESPYSRPLVIARRPPSSITPKGPRVKKATLFDIRRRPFAHAYLLAAFRLLGGPTARANAARITCGSLGAAPRRWSVVASHYPRLRCGGLDRRRLLSGQHPRP